MTVKNLTFLSAVLFALGCSVSCYSNSEKTSKDDQVKEENAAKEAEVSESSDAKINALLNRKPPQTQSASSGSKKAPGDASAASAPVDKMGNGQAAGKSMVITPDLMRAVSPEVLEELKKRREEEKSKAE